MPVGRGGGLGRQRRFAQYPPHTFATVPQGVLAELVARSVGRNGWAVMVALCRKLYDDGLLGRSSSAEVSELTGLTPYQVARGDGIKQVIEAKLRAHGVEPTWFEDKATGKEYLLFRIAEAQEVWDGFDELSRETESAADKAAEKAKNAYTGTATGGRSRCARSRPARRPPRSRPRGRAPGRRPAGPASRN